MRRTLVPSQSLVETEKPRNDIKMAAWGPDCRQNPLTEGKFTFVKQTQEQLGRCSSSSDCSFALLELEAPAASCGQASTALYVENSLDSLASEPETVALACDENLLSAEPPLIKVIPVKTTPPSIFALGPQLSTGCELSDIIRNEMQRESETAPAIGFMERHSGSGLTPEMRTIAVSWLVEVVGEFQLQQETLFLAVSYLDRFLSVAQGLPKAMLQLVAVACISLAAKQEEIQQPSANEWADVADHCFKTEDLLKMEWLVMDNLGWRGRTPTPYSFLHLFCYGLASCPAPTICVASYITELTLLEYGAAGCSYSTLAAAALVVAHAVTGVPVNVRALHALAQDLDMMAVHKWCPRLAEVHRQACLELSIVDQGGAPTCPCIHPVTDKYKEDAWARAAYYPAVDVDQVLACF